MKDHPHFSPPRNLPATVPSTDLPMHLSNAVAVFRGLQTGVFDDWYEVSVRAIIPLTSVLR